MPPLVRRVQQVLETVLVGKPEAIDRVLVGILARGHVLLEDVPGVGKTTLAKALSRALALSFSRVQFTPDLLPSDILGSPVLSPQDGTITFRPGPIFTQLLLADELNRASPRTQSALLEAMNEGQVTVDGLTHPLPNPFLVIATQNPGDASGTYPLPEAQLDRFLLRFSIGYPSTEDELKMMADRKVKDPLDAVEATTTVEELLIAQEQVRDVSMKDELSKYVLALVAASRTHADVEQGVSPRGSLALSRVTQAEAYLRGRTYATPDDVHRVAEAVLAHRLRLSPAARFGGVTASAIVKEILARVPVPV
jgi:MoxR-like ATPase